MNLEQLREIARAKRGALVALAALFILDLCLYGYLVLLQRPALEKARVAYFQTRAQAGSPGERRARVYRAGEEDLAQFESRIIAKSDFASFLSELYDMSQGQGLEIKGITYQPRTLPEQGLVLYEMSLTVDGNYPSVKRFIAQLGGYPRIVTVDSVSLKNPSSTEETVELVLRVTAFLKREDA